MVLVNPKYTLTSMVSALSTKQAFYADPTTLNLQLVNFEKRKEQVELFFNSDLDGQKISWLKDNKIRYIFTDNKQISNNLKLGLQKIFQNNTITIYQLYDY